MILATMGPIVAYLLLDDRRLMAQTLPCLIDQRCHCFAGKATNEFPHLLQLIHCVGMHKYILQNSIDS